jgi:hypothetical protein
VRFVNGHQINRLIQLPDIMSDDKTQVIEASKANHQVLTTDTQYRGLSQEDADFMRQYEGEKGKKIVRKVSFVTPPSSGHAAYLLCRSIIV